MIKRSGCHGRDMTEIAAPDAIRIVSGGQTGVDRAALDAALAAGVECGGWCPRGRRAEDGPIASRYPLFETDSEAYSVRTRQNVYDSDATVIIHFGRLFGGTAKTQQYCEQLNRPCLLIDGSQIKPSRAARKIAEFRINTGALCLNFAGPRASGEPRVYAYALSVVSALLDPGDTDGAA